MSDPEHRAVDGRHMARALELARHGPVHRRTQPSGRMRDCPRRADRRRGVAPVRRPAARRDSCPCRGGRRCEGRDGVRDAGAMPPHRAHRPVYPGIARSRRIEGGGGDARPRSEGLGPGHRRACRGGYRGRDRTARDPGSGAQSRVRLATRAGTSLAPVQARRDAGRPDRHRGRREPVDHRRGSTRRRSPAARAGGRGAHRSRDGAG